MMLRAPIPTDLPGSLFRNTRASFIVAPSLRHIEVHAVGASRQRGAYLTSALKDLCSDGLDIPDELGISGSDLLQLIM